MDSLQDNLQDNLPWSRPTPDQILIAGDRYLVAIALRANDPTKSSWEYHVVIPTESGFDNSDGDTWCTWTWSDVEWYIHERHLKPPQ